MLHEGLHLYASVLSPAYIIRRLFQTLPKGPNTPNFPLYFSSHLFIKFTSSFPCLFPSCTHTHTHTHTLTLSLLTYFLRALQMAHPPLPLTPSAALTEFVKYTYIYKYTHTHTNARTHARTIKQLDHFTVYLGPYLAPPLSFAAFCVRSVQNCASK